MTDGVVGSGKFLGVLATGSTVLFPATSFYSQWFEPALVPWVHYVPVWETARDDLVSVVAWLQSHPREAQSIANAGRTFVCEHFAFEGRVCWWTKMFETYRNTLAGYVMDAEWFALRGAEFNLTEITKNLLRCDSTSRTHNGLPTCTWSGK